MIAADATADAAAARAQRLLDEAPDLLAAARAARLADLADPARLSTGVARDDRALAWARVSLDNLVMEQRGVGVYAGFYWFTTYWGRDTFIVLPGRLVAGLDFATAREILRSFAAYQDRDPAEPALRPRAQLRHRRPGAVRQHRRHLVVRARPGRVLAALRRRRLRPRDDPGGAARLRGGAGPRRRRRRAS